MYENEINEKNLIYLNDELSNLREEVLLTSGKIKFIKNRFLKEISIIYTD
jgi:hypothetical protein